MQRVLVIGACGAGKSTLAQRLGAVLRLPVIHLDQEYWKPGWVDPPAPEWQATLAELLARPCWVMDGNYGGSLEQRLRHADSVVLLDYPRRVHVWRLLRRNWTMRGRTRADMAAYCPERFSWSFLVYTWRFRRDKLPRTLERIARSGLPLTRLRHPRAAEEWLGDLTQTVAHARANA